MWCGGGCGAGRNGGSRCRRPGHTRVPARPERGDARGVATVAGEVVTRVAVGGDCDLVAGGDRARARPDSCNRGKSRRTGRARRPVLIKPGRASVPWVRWGRGLLRQVRGPRLVGGIEEAGTRRERRWDADPGPGGRVRPSGTPCGRAARREGGASVVAGGWRDPGSGHRAGPRVPQLATGRASGGIGRASAQRAVSGLTCRMKELLPGSGPIERRERTTKG
jgi:hypothetical protein